MTQFSFLIPIMKSMRKVLAFITIVTILLLSSCQPADPEAGLPLKLAEQVSLQAFKKINPTALAWSNLMPADYQPSYQRFPWTVENPEEMMKQTLEETPLVEELNGKNVKVSGYVVPLDGTDEAIHEFLLVPFLGACTHVPPPPANQIVYVKPKYPLLMDESWDIISVVGKLNAEGRTSGLGAVGYQMIDSILTSFDESEYSGVINTPVVVDGLGADEQPITPPVEDR